MSESLTIKDWAEEDKPREKLLQKSPQALSDAELIAILIGSGNREESAVELSKRILKKANFNLNEIGKFSISNLMDFKGIGEAKAISIVAALELGKRRKLSEILEKQKISSSKDTFDFFNAFISDLSYEEFWVIYLNRANKIIDKVKISQGGISGTVIDVRIIIKSAIEKLASSIILGHNHPSGNLKPSKADVEITKKIQTAANYFDIKILDHLIIGDKEYYSFADDGLI